MYIHVCFMKQNLKSNKKQVNTTLFFKERQWRLVHLSPHSHSGIWRSLRHPGHDRHNVYVSDPRTRTGGVWLNKAEILICFFLLSLVFIVLMSTFTQFLLFFSYGLQIYLVFTVQRFTHSRCSPDIWQMNSCSILPFH